jgi:hypothetical protein
MLFTNVLTYAIAFASATPMVAALYHWDYTLGEAPSAFKNPGRYSPRISAEWMGLCNGGDIPEGGYGCATFVEDATVICKLTQSPFHPVSSHTFHSRSVQSS